MRLPIKDRRVIEMVYYLNNETVVRQHANGGARFRDNATAFMLGGRVNYWLDTRFVTYLNTDHAMLIFDTDVSQNFAQFCDEERLLVLGLSIACKFLSVA